MIGLFEQHDPITHDVREEVAAQLQLGVYIVNAVIDRAHLGAQA